MKKSLTSAVTAILFAGATAASAATVTLQATINNVTGDANLLSELGIAAGGTLTAFVTFDSDVSADATNVSNQFYTYDYLRSPYVSVSLAAPSGSITAPQSCGACYVHTQNGISDGSRNINDVFTVSASAYSLDPSYYRVMYLQSYDSDERTWARTAPITASILNSFTVDNFVFERNMPSGGGITRIARVYSTDIVWSDMAPVPLPAGLPLLLAGFGALAIASRRRRA